ncbi:uncharacterized protein ALTATR162_LOCUS10358 [Alternaria atra]|uniref:Uncharacterized protein n=1 Tax=Alternaria atra TaxID=119953 RepID=A0A8J2IDY0_9PLEO|nr:uncharacterized protein ALTATR162_LOCUS10358 [Alternaria atra]CAG5182834.1 unnamed protein product [Alternaria atra]
MCTLQYSTILYIRPIISVFRRLSNVLVSMRSRHFRLETNTRKLSLWIVDKRSVFLWGVYRLVFCSCGSSCDESAATAAAAAASSGTESKGDSLCASLPAVADLLNPED